jgi:hypothetical protein
LFSRVIVKASVCMLLAACTTSLFAYQGKPAGDSKPKAEKKSQVELASKTALATVAATSADVKKALDAKDLPAATKLTSKEGAFKGTVSMAYAPKSNALIILNFDPDYKKAVTAVVRNKEFGKFPNLETLVGKHILVKGKFEDYRGAPEIVLLDAAQIKIIK